MSIRPELNQQTCSRFRLSFHDSTTGSERRCSREQQEDAGWLGCGDKWCGWLSTGWVGDGAEELICDPAASCYGFERSGIIGIRNSVTRLIERQIAEIYAEGLPGIDAG